MIELAIFESAAILICLIGELGRLLPADTAGRFEVMLAPRPGMVRGCEVPPSPGKAELAEAAGASITTQ